jgi:hypothetical protein
MAVIGDLGALADEVVYIMFPRDNVVIAALAGVGVIIPRDRVGVIIHCGRVGRFSTVGRIVFVRICARASGKNDCGNNAQQYACLQ